jgi:hypothetical protein
MSESEWLTCTDPQKMLVFLRVKASDRKLRLFACACCRVLWSDQLDAAGRRAIDVAEHFADGEASSAMLRHAVRAAFHGRSRHPALFANYFWQAHLVFDVDVALGWAAAYDTCRYARHISIARSDAARLQAELFRDLFGNPFRPMAPPDPAVLAWNGNAVRELAETIGAGHRFEDLPVLADRLEKAGCTNDELPAHCRRPGPHVRGCWAIDLLLAKE